MTNPSAALPFTPLIIIGAGRSGTNALRDMLCRLPGFASWPCDEINPIWRHGNLFWPDDALPANRATPAVRRFIRRAFTRRWAQAGRPLFMVEKTCANSLRVPFVASILPEARFIFLLRDGVDVVASASKRWRGEMELPQLAYFAAKARFTPLRDLPVYGARFLRNRLGLMRGRPHLHAWGPRYPGMEAHATLSLAEQCARQWIACTEASSAALADLDPARVLKLRYEDMTVDPHHTLTQITAFTGGSVGARALTNAASLVRGGSVGKGRRAQARLPDALLDLMNSTLSRFGY